MRPVDRGPCPTQPDGTEVTFVEYGYARPYLIGRLGDYCSFCEMQLSNLDVEHILHKDGNPALERTWSNLLLACWSCNSTKGTKIGTAEQASATLWPDLDRTYEAFLYETDGVVRVAPHDDRAVVTRRQATADLVGLLKRPGHGLTRDQLLKASDRRWEKRRDAWDQAMDARRDLADQDTPTVRRLVLKLAKSNGFWSVWLTVFRDDPEMVEALCDDANFRGTARGRALNL